MPLLRVIVAVEEDLLVLLDDAWQDSAERLAQTLALALRLLQMRGDVIERLRHDGVQHRVRSGDGERRADGPELELVASERERTGAVAVAGVARQRRQHADAHVHEAALLGRLRAALLDLIDHPL